MMHTLAVGGGFALILAAYALGLSVLAGAAHNRPRRLRVRRRR